MLTNHELIPIMPYSVEETPIIYKPRVGFQGLTQDYFCQTWNLFCQRLLIDNYFTEDINTFIFEHVVMHAEPILSPSVVPNNETQTRINLTMILIEFMFYIRMLMSEEFDKWMERYRLPDFETYMNKYFPDDLCIGIQEEYTRRGLSSPAYNWESNSFMIDIPRYDYSTDSYIGYPEFNEIEDTTRSKTIKNFYERKMEEDSSYKIHNDVTLHIELNMSDFLSEAIRDI